MSGWDRLPFLIAHRGYSSIAPENTLAAFEAAIEAGAEVLECDVQLSADGVVVVMHDPTVDRTTDGRGAVRDLEWDTLRGLDAGYPERFGSAFADEKVPRLDYKDERKLQRFITDHGKIVPRRVSGCCAKHQANVSQV